MKNRSLGKTNLEISEVGLGCWQFGGDFGPALGPDDFFDNRQTDRIMAFDVNQDFDTNVPDVSPTAVGVV